jgi:hypothetical protein
MGVETHLEFAVNLNQFGNGLWKRYMALGFQRPFALAVSAFVLMGLLDMVFHLAIVWRLAVLVGVTLSLILSYRHLSKKKARPSEEELYYLACEIAGEQTFESESKDLSLPETALKPLAYKLYLSVALLILVLCFFENGRMAFKRNLFLTGEWEPWTRLENVTVPVLVLQGEPIHIEFDTLGRQPKMVKILIDGKAKTLASGGSDHWAYDFFHEAGEFELRIVALDAQSPAYHIRVLAFPTLISSKITYLEPSYLGGDEKTIEGLTARLPEGSKVSLAVKFRDLKKLNKPKSFVSTGFQSWQMDLGVVTQDRTLQLDGRGHEDLPDTELVTFRFKVVFDRKPQIKDLKPGGVIAYLPQGSLRMRFRAIDDHKIEKVGILYGGEKIFLDEDETVVDYLIDLRPLKLVAGDVVYFQPWAIDNKGQTSSARRLRVQIVDEATYKSYLLEEHQRIHQKLEELIASMGRRVKRHEGKKLFEADVERSTLRADSDKVRILDESMQRYTERLRQIADFEKIATRNEKDRSYIASTVPVLLSRLMRKDDAQIDSQKRIVEKLKEISVRMAEGQDLHLIVRLIDQIINKEIRVIDKLPD